MEVAIRRRLGFEEGLDLGSEGRVDAEEMTGGGARLAAVRVDEEGGRGADGFEQDAGEGGERLEAVGVDRLGIVEGVDKQLAEELGDVDVIEEAGEAAQAAAGGGTAFAAGFGLGLGVGGIVEETEGAAGEGAGGAGGVVGFGVSAGGGHGFLGVQAVLGGVRPGDDEHEHEHE